MDDDNQVDDLSDEYETSNKVLSTEVASDFTSDEEEPHTDTPATKRQKIVNSITEETGTNDQTTVFVGQLPTVITAPHLREFFTKKAGEINKIIIMKFKDTGKPMGSAFIEFESVSGAENACKLNGERVLDFEKILEENNIKSRWSAQRGFAKNKKEVVIRVNMATAKPIHASGKHLKGGRKQDGLTLFVGNLHYKVSEGTVRKLFEKHGTVVRVAIPRDFKTKLRRGFAMVEYNDPQAVQQALALNGTLLRGRPLIVDIQGSSVNKAHKSNVGDKRKRLS